MNRRHLLQLSAGAFVALACSVAPEWSFADTLDFNEAINKAGRQRMLSQRMTKAWLAVGLNVESTRAERVLSQSIALFDKQLGELKATVPDAPTVSTLTQLDGQWAPLKAALTERKPEKNRAAGVLGLEGKVLQLAQQSTQQLEKSSNKSLGKMVNLAGRQRMLSQRAAKYYLASIWGVDPSVAAVEIAKARTEFTAALQILLQAPESTAQIRAELNIAAQQWVFFDNALSQRVDDAQAATHAAEVFTASENILNQMEQVTALFARQKAA